MPARGFTIIELLLTMAVVAVLAAVALPSYRGYAQRAARADAKAALLENAQFLERNFSEAYKYDKTAAGDDVVLPATRAPRDGTTVMYDIALDASATTATTYRLVATPVAGSPQASDDCGSLTLNQLGQRSATGTRPAADCWR